MEGEKSVIGASQDASMYSTAYNFYSHIAANVDPRTGIYSASVEFTTGQGNHLRGPSFTFRLVFNPFSARDDGFGVGWELDITRLDLAGDIAMICLGGGERFTIRRLPEGQPAEFPDRKLESFRLIAGPGRGSATVEHITGMVETLTVLAGNRLSELRVTRIAQPNGDGLDLEWGGQTASGGIGLTRVTDDEGTELLKIDYPDERHIELTLANGGPEPVKVTFIRSGASLIYIGVPAIAQLNARETPREYEAEWTFDYGSYGTPPMQLLDTVTTPDGVVENVTYNQYGLTLPKNAPREKVPVVASRVRRLAANLATILARSEYTFDADQNHYGSNMVGDWEDSTDQLLHVTLPNRYDYGSVERQIVDDGSAIVTERTYNHFHLMIFQRTRRGAVVQQIETNYGEKAGLSFEDQPASLQLPTDVINLSYHQDNPDLVLRTSSETTYDDFGNALTTTDVANGITESSIYYPPEGEGTLCPPDPLGKVRRLRSRTTIPGPGGGQERRVTYQYCTLPVLANPVEGNEARDVYVQACGEIEEASVDGEWVRLSESHQGFIDDLGPHHGRIASEMKTVDGVAEVREYEYTIDDSQMTTTVTHTVDNGVDRYGMPRKIVNRTSETQRLIDGLVVATVDAAGNRTATEYDTLGRRTREVVHPGDADYEADTRWAYMLSIDQRWIERTGITGLKHKQWFDTAGHPIQSDEPLPDGSSYPALRQEYDLLGQCTKEITTDRLQNDRELVLTTEYEYDDWGNCCRAVAPGGSETRTTTELLVDPALYNGAVFQRTTQWQEYDKTRPAGWASTLRTSRSALPGATPWRWEWNRVPASSAAIGGRASTRAST